MHETQDDHCFAQPFELTMNVPNTKNPILRWSHLRPVIFSVLLGACFTLASCSTIVNGSRQEISIMASPADARIVVDSTFLGAGLLHIELSRASSHLVEISK